jgi:hypothetical protein
MPNLVLPITRKRRGVTVSVATDLMLQHRPSGQNSTDQVRAATFERRINARQARTGHFTEDNNDVPDPKCLYPAFRLVNDRMCGNQPPKL